jgi:signal transduction histidine kinase
MKRLILLFCLCIAAIGAACPALSQPVVKLSANSKSVKLEGFMARAENVSPSATIAEMASPDRQGDFIHMPKGISGGYSNFDHWYRFTLVRQIGAPGHWVLAMGSQVLNEIYIYEPSQRGDFIEHRLGDHGQITAKHVISRMHALRLDIDRHEPMTFYVRIRSNSVLSFTATLWQPEALLVTDEKYSFFLGAVLGIFAIIAVVYFLFGLLLKDGLLIGFTIYVMALFATYFGVNGFTELIFGNEPTWLNDLLVGCGTICSCAIPLLLWDRLLALKEKLKIAHKIFMLVMPVMLIGNLFVTTEYYSYFARASFLIVFIAIGCGLVICSLILAREGLKATLVVCFAAFSILFVVGSLQIMLILGLVPQTTLGETEFQVFSLLHVMLLALGLALRIKELEKDRSQAREEARLSALAAEEQRHFVGMLANEFRAPLADIEKAALAIEATAGVLPDKAKERLERIRGQSHQLGGMVDSFLVAEAFKHGAIALKTDKVRLDSLFAELVDRHAELVSPERLAYQVSPPDLEAILDVEMMEIAIGNLIANALRYSPPTTPVRVSAQIVNGAICVTVADQGAGMTEEEVARLGEMYFRAQSAKGTKGTGLGLHMTKLIIAAHGGDWQIVSHVGEGTRITIRLPQKETGATA